VKTTEVLKNYNFAYIETIECLIRSMQIARGKNRPHTMMTGHTGYITRARKTINPETISSDEDTN
jgi:tRNA A58 N-methylase Trm61